jgi:hypothetical protein
VHTHPTILSISTIGSRQTAPLVLETIPFLWLAILLPALLHFRITYYAGPSLQGELEKRGFGKIDTSEPRILNQRTTFTFIPSYLYQISSHSEKGNFSTERQGRFIEVLNKRQHQLPEKSNSVLWRSIPRRLIDRLKMSSNSNNPFISPSRNAPHIRLNSAQENLSFSDDSPSPTIGASRSLVPSNGALHSQPSQRTIYTAASVLESQQRLLPPTRSRSHRFRDDESPIKSPAESAFSSRRTSWSSERSRDSRGFENPFSDRSRPPSRSDARGDSDDENLNTQTVSEKYNILPSAGLLLFPEDIEKDDYLHTPDPSGKEDRDCDVFTRRGLVNVGGLVLIVLGLLALFIGYPVL